MFLAGTSGKIKSFRMFLQKFFPGPQQNLLSELLKGITAAEEKFCQRP